MTEENKYQLTPEEEAERIEKKVRIRRIISNFLIVIACISIIVFAVMMFLTKENIDTQTSIDTQELRSKLKQIIALEKRYFEENGEYALINYLSLCKPIPRYNPNLEGNYKYKFDPKSGIATGIERDASHDVNGDEDGRDGLTLSINWEAGKTDGSDFSWADEDMADFERRIVRDQ